MKRRLALLAASLLVLAACGGDEGASRDDYVDAATDALADAGDDENVTFDDDDAECLAEAVVDAIGVDELNDAGISADDFVEVDALEELDVDIDDDVVDAMTDAVQDCEINFANSLAEEITGQFGEGVLSDEALECVGTEIGASQELAEVFAESLITGNASGGEAAGFEAAQAAFGECPEALTGFFAAGLEQGGLTVSDEAKDCLNEQVAQLSDEEIDALVSQSAEASTIGQNLATACSAELGLG